MCAYRRTAFLTEAVQAILSQSYPHWELILVNNGATPEVIALLNYFEASDTRIRVLHYEDNNSSKDDPVKFVHTCCNAALKASTGDYIWFQSDDDLLAKDYIEKMVNLFDENPECTTAAGLPCSMDENSNVMSYGQRISNIRPRYISGKDMVLQHTLENQSVFSSPGPIFTIRRDALISAGGFHRAIELSHLFGIVPFGVTGFDETALFYWRRHEGQFNHATVASGWLAIDETFDLLRAWNLKNRWQLYGTQAATRVIRFIQRRLYETCGFWFVTLLLRGKRNAAFRIFSKMWWRIGFWNELLCYTKQLIQLRFLKRRQ